MWQARALSDPVIARYLGALAGGNLLWETAHMPLYTLWLSGTPGEIAFAILHCTAGDVLIGAVTLGLAVLLLGRGWPAAHFGRVAAAAMALGLGYTVFSEWLNVSLRGSWAYRDLMPILPVLGTGLTPVLQWILLPAAAFAWLRQTLRG